MSGVPKWTEVELAVAVLSELAQLTARKLGERERVRQAALQQARERQLAQTRASEVRLLEAAVGGGDATGSGPAQEALRRLAVAAGEAEILQAIAYSRFVRARLKQAPSEASADLSAAREQVEVQLRLSDEEANLAELERDPVVGVWLSGDLVQARLELTGLASLMGQGSWVDLHQRLEEFHQAVESKLAWAAEQQRKADQRDYVAAKMRECLAALGLAQISSPRKEHADHPMSATVITASVDQGRTLEVSVPFQDGGDEQVFYTVGGFNLHGVFTVGGEQSECPEAQVLLERLHEELAAQGVNTNGLHWEKQPRQSRQGMAKALPISREDEDDASS